MTFYELEKRCKKKRLIKIFVFLVLLLCFLSGVFFYFFTSQKQDKPILKVVKKTIDNKEINKSKKQLNKITPLQKLSLNKEINQSKNNKIKKQKKTQQLIFVLPEINTTEKVKPVIKEKKLLEKNNSKIIIKSTSLPSFETCISIAQKYLEEKDYQNALKWAKFANIQNKNNPISWIISAKALYYMGKKQEAIKLLKIYNSYYNNKEVEKLIKDFSNE